MSEFAGIIRFDGERIDESLAQWLAQSINGAAVSCEHFWRDARALFVHRLSRYGSNQVDRQPLQITSGETLVSDVRLDERKELRQQLGLDPLQQIGDVALLAAAYARWGESAAERLYGDFAFALWDSRENKLVLARDALGVRALYYAVSDRFVAFSTQLRTLLSVPDIPRELDEIALADFITLAPSNGSRTLYRHIHRVPSGGIMTFRGTACSVNNYWNAEKLSPIRYSRDDDYVEAARELLDRAVAYRLERVEPIASMLSGGFDSAAVTATAARLLGGQRLTAYTRVPGAPHPYDALDERALAAQVVARYPNIEWVILDDDAPALRDSEPESEAAQMGLPRRNAFNPTWFEPFFLRATQAGAKVALAGTMGNVVLSWPGQSRFRELLRGGRFFTALSELNRTARQDNRSFAYVFLKYALPLLEPRQMRRWRHSRRLGGYPWRRYCLISPDFAAEIGYAPHARDIGHDIPFHPDLDGKSIRASMLRNEHHHDIEGIARLRYGLEMRDPYCDRRFAEFTLALPEDQFLRHGQSRWLARRVLADRLSKELLSQTRRGRQCPEWHYLASRRIDKLRHNVERIERSPLASRVLDVKRMKALLDTWPSEAEAAKGKESLYQYALHRGIIVGSFLRWFEGGNA